MQSLNVPEFQCNYIDFDPSDRDFTQEICDGYLHWFMCTGPQEDCVEIDLWCSENIQGKWKILNGSSRAQSGEYYYHRDIWIQEERDAALLRLWWC